MPQCPTSCSPFGSIRRTSFPPPLGTADLFGAFVAGRNPRTLKAYARDLDDFARFLGQPSAAVAVELLLAGGQGSANAACLAYRTRMSDRKVAPADSRRCGRWRSWPAPRARPVVD